MHNLQLEKRLITKDLNACQAGGVPPLFANSEHPTLVRVRHNHTVTGCINGITLHLHNNMRS